MNLLQKLASGGGTYNPVLDSGGMSMLDVFSQLMAALPETLTLPCATGIQQRKKIHSVKALPGVTLGKKHTASTVSINSYLSSVFYRALGKKKVVC